MDFLKPNDTILFIGDSITDGGRARTGNDFNHTMGQGYAFIISAQLGARFAEHHLTFLNRGISGNRVPDLQSRWEVDVLDLSPTVLSILIGINDATLPDPQPAEEFERVYDGLIRETLARLPGVRIILCEPFLLPVGSYEEAWETAFPEVQKRQQSVARLAGKYGLRFVAYQKAFDEACRRAPADHWCWDGVHPHYAGHGLMADEWLKTVL